MSELIVKRENAHWAITLCRPDKLNALSGGLVEELIAAMDEAIAAQVPMVSFSGEGKCFSAGFDMSDVDSQSDGDLLLRFVRIEMLLNRIASAPCLTVAFAHGRNFGAGVDLVGACKMRYCAPATTFRMPGLQFGLVLGTARLARLVGAGAAQRLLATSATFDADHAQRIGFIDAVAAPEQWEQAAAAQAERASFLPPQSRELLYRTLDDECADADLATLVRSAARPGIKSRIAAYRAAAPSATRPS